MLLNSMFFLQLCTAKAVSASILYSFWICLTSPSVKWVEKKFWWIKDKENARSNVKTQGGKTMSPFCKEILSKVKTWRKTWRRRRRFGSWKKKPQMPLPELPLQFQVRFKTNEHLWQQQYFPVSFPFASLIVHFGVIYFWRHPQILWQTVCLLRRQF